MRERPRERDGADWRQGDSSTGHHTRDWTEQDKDHFKDRVKVVVSPSIGRHYED
jgi:hypothetical protein